MFFSWHTQSSPSASEPSRALWPPLEFPKRTNSYSSTIMNGQANSAVAKASMPAGQPQSLVPRSKTRTPKKSVLASFLSTFARLLLWYCVLTATFRCPSSLSNITDESPNVCKPYLRIKSHIAPHVSPHYNHYLKPYVDLTDPYIDRLNEQLYDPVASFTKRNYQAYAAAHVQSIQKQAGKTWSAAIQPQIEASERAVQEAYGRTLAPHVDKVTAVTVPHLNRAKDEALEIFDTTLVPLYHRTLPYLQAIYAHGHHITAHAVLPYVRKVETSALSFLNRRIWPQLVILYGENVEPQLMRISERLGRYKDTKKLEAEIDSLNSSEKMVLSHTASPSSAVTLSSTGLKPSGTPKKLASAASKNSDGNIDPREKLATDLKTWHDRFARAAEKGTEDLNERVKEITTRQIGNQAHGVGNAMVVRLEETSKSELEALKPKIRKAVERLPETASPEDIEEAYAGLVADIRASGAAVKEQAQAVRTWKQKYDQETLALIKTALESTLSVIDNIRDLGLQDIGMRWASMEGVTYKDWSKYSELKGTFEKWREGVGAAALNHDGLLTASQAGDEVLDKAMDVAEQTAKELARLKDVAKWKLDAGDSSHDFDTKTIPAKVARASRAAIDSAKEIFEGEAKPAVDASQGVAHQLAYAASAASDITEDLSQTVLGKSSSASRGANSVLSAAKKKTEQIVSAIIGTPGPVAEDAVDLSDEVPNASAPTPKKVWGGAMAAEVAPREIILDDDFVDEDDSYADQLNSLISKLRDSTPTTGTGESVASWGSAQYASAMLAASSVLYGTSTGAVESATSVAAEKYSQAYTAASYAIYGTPTPYLQSLTAQASSKYEEAVQAAKEQYSAAASAASVAVSGSPKPAYEKTLSSIDEAYSSQLRVASGQLHSALASITGFLSRPTQGVMESASSVASSRLQEGLSQASAQYSRARAAISAEPTPSHQKYMSEVQRRYYEGIGMAHDRYDKFLEAASVAVYGTSAPAYQRWAQEASKTVFGTTPPAYQTLASAAQSRYTAASVAAQEKLNSVLNVASSAAGKTSKSPAQSVLDAASSQYSSALAAAQDALSAASTSASIAVYGTPKPAYVSLLSAAQGRYSSAVLAASSNLDGILSSASSVAGKTSKSPAQSVLESASASYAAAVVAASSAFQSASASASVAIYGTPTGHAEYLASVASASLFGTEVPWTEAQASKIAGNYEAFLSKASEQIYGTPTPFTESIWSQAGDYAAQATAAAAEQYAAVQALVSDLVVGREPAFTESVMSRLNSAYATGAPALASSASSYASEAYGSASSVITSVFTPPPALDDILQGVSDRVNAVIDEASAQIYGTQKGYVEEATSAAAGAYSSAQAAASKAVYGEEPGYLDSAQSRFDEIASSAQSAVSAAIYGTSTGVAEAAGSSVASAYSAAYSAANDGLSAANGAVKDQYERAGSGVADQYASASSHVSSIIYGPEQGAAESVSSRVAAVMENARARLAGLTPSSTGVAEAQLSKAKAAAGSASARLKDEL
ncbi:hypothetical protein EJ06DRAFT_532393 [Trichodelitschia bisporula]|uniref:Transcription factor hoxa13 n=1 Tax=Trichodelitschia bisporula TaxID=703511 RepID=A0A6G1HQA0_9PEZI|nr:hypothetical protein EJ06DRAFT_532393 [Trichodelitschia bisporula]